MLRVLFNLLSLFGLRWRRRSSPRVSRRPLVGGSAPETKADVTSLLMFHCRVGKWRSKELFAGGRKTCNLSHLRLGSLEEMT